MTNQTFYLKYRPQILSDLDIVSVREKLLKIVESQNIPHAMLFAGPKGTGKTSAARIIAKIINCIKNEKKLDEPCNKCDSCLSITNTNSIDVIEIDAASNRGIDEARAIREAVKLSPISSRNKVYIIDEAHMLTLDACNALLKTLEEPPPHVYFILATTNPEKIIDTIKSRTFTVNFSKASDAEIISSLTKKLKTEKREVNKEILTRIVSKANGSLRDAVKLIEEEVNFKSDSNNDLQLNTEEIIDLIKREKLKEVYKIIKTYYLNGGNILVIIEEMIKCFEDAEINEENLLWVENLEDTYRKTKQAYSPFLAFMGFVYAMAGKKQPYSVLQSGNMEGKENNENESEDVVVSVEKLSQVDNEVWNKLLEKIKNVNTSVEALLRSSKPLGLEGDVLTLEVYYKFHKERLEDERNRRVLEGIVSDFFNNSLKVKCVLSEPKKEVKEDIVQIAQQIFEV